jgi:diguanylate cyclase (GGDEF)-like protein
MPLFDGLTALREVRSMNTEVPFIMVSSVIGEEMAAGAMKNGANDYVMKGNLARLAPAVERELREAEARRGQKARLHLLAYYDAITGLGNRALFCGRLAEHMGAAAREHHKLAVAVIDVNRFAAINGSLGRRAGDALLAQLGARLAQCAADPGHVARVGADQFAVMHPQMHSERHVAQAMQAQVRQCLAEPFLLDGGEYRVTARIGIAMFPQHGTDAELLLRNAEAAVARAKAAAEPLVFYTGQMTEGIAAKLVLENRLRYAIERGEFELHYQPKVSFQDRRIVAVEALIRWRSPELGLVAPSAFIPLLEETGMIVEVGAWVLGQAVRDRAYWLARGATPPRIAVNVSAVQLGRIDFVAMVKDAVEFGPGLPGIDLEITESQLVGDTGGCIGKLAAMRDLGMSIAIDDFGTGYSSLGYLAMMPLASLKIDRSFVAAMLQDAHTLTLVTTIIGMAHALGLKVVAEGVETETQARKLSALGCDQMQGFLTGRPVPREEMTELLEAA